MQLINKTAIVTGGGQGIGKAIALAFAAAGADIIIQYCSSKDNASRAADEIVQLGRKSIALQSDFTEEAAPELFFNDSLKAFGKIDILVNCAAAYDRGYLMELSAERFSLMHKMNVEVPFRLIQSVARHLIERRSSGSIIIALP